MIPRRCSPVLGIRTETIAGMHRAGAGDFHRPRAWDVEVALLSPQADAESLIRHGERGLHGRPSSGPQRWDAEMRWRIPAWRPPRFVPGLEIVESPQIRLGDGDHRPTVFDGLPFSTKMARRRRSMASARSSRLLDDADRLTLLARSPTETKGSNLARRAIRSREGWLTGTARSSAAFEQAQVLRRSQRHRGDAMQLGRRSAPAPHRSLWTAA